MSNAATFDILPLVSSTFDRNTIDLEGIKKRASLGLDDCPPEDHALAWLSMLHIYPSIPGDWSKRITAIKFAYMQFVKEYGLEGWENKYIPNQCPTRNFTVGDGALMSLIHADVIRTGRIIFFLDPLPLEGVVPDKEEEPFFQFAGHARRLERILYLFAIVNIGVGYMQGFNELLVPFYFVLMKSKQLFEGDLDTTEAFAFQCLQTLITDTDLHEFYNTNESSLIIAHRLDNFTKLVEKHLPDVHQILENGNVNPFMYCFRWFTLLFSQEYDLPNLLLLWDGLFTHFDEMMDYAMYIGLGHLQYAKPFLTMQMSGGKITEVLQHLDISNVPELLGISNQYWNEDHDIQDRGFFGYIKGVFSKKK